MRSRMAKRNFTPRAGHSADGRTAGYGQLRDSLRPIAARRILKASVAVTEPLASVSQRATGQPAAPTALRSASSASAAVIVPLASPSPHRGGIAMVVVVGATVVVVTSTCVVVVASTVVVVTSVLVVVVVVTSE